MTNILIISAQYDYKQKQVLSGVDYHRLLAPYDRLRKDYPDEYHCTIARTPFHLTPEQLKEIDFVVFSSSMFFENKGEVKFHPKGLFGSKDIIQYLQNEFDITVICDVDDSWVVPKEHSHYNLIYNNIVAGKSIKTHIIDAILHSDIVTTTTSPLKKLIEGLSSSIDVEIIPNGIDSSNEMFSTKKNTSKDYVTFGYAKVTSQLEELQMMEEYVDWAFTKDNFRLKFVGFDGGAHHRKVHRVISKNEQATTKQYGYVPRVTPSVYGIGYQDIDVLITPLADTKYNNCKSNIKQVECAFTDTIFLGSNVLPYSATNFGLKCSNVKQFIEYTEHILEDFEDIKEMSISTSHNMDKYELKVVNQKRHELFKSFD